MRDLFPVLCVVKLWAIFMIMATNTLLSRQVGRSNLRVEHMRLGGAVTTFASDVNE